MRRLLNLPTYVILGFLTIYYIAIFFNLQSLLAKISANTPLLIGYFLMLLLAILPISLKASAVYENPDLPNKKKTFKTVIWFTAIIISIFGILIATRTDLSNIWKTILAGSFLADFHRMIIGFVTISITYIFFFLLLDIIKIEEFLDNVKALKFVSPVFCFGAPAFWKKSLETLKIPENEISFLGGISFFCGVIFLISIIVFFIAKSVNDEEATPAKSKKVTFLKTSLALTFLALAILLFVCLDISYFIATT